MKSIRRIYLAHAYGGKPENLEKAERWLRWCYDEKHLDGVVYRARVDAAVVLGCDVEFHFCMNWALLARVLDDSNPEHRRRGREGALGELLDCDELWLVGGEISPGMADEVMFARVRGILIRDFTDLGKEPPQ